MSGERSVEAPRATRQGGPRGSSVTLTGEWAPLPGRIVDIAATDDMLFLADVPETGHPMRVHAGRWRDGLWRWETPWSVPWPPTVPVGHDLSGTGAWLGVEARHGGTNVTLDRIEYQGGSHGIALTTLTNGTWGAVQEIASPTDSDIAFGRPAHRRGDALLTPESSDRLWHYTRTGIRWNGRPIAVPTGADIPYEPCMDVDADGDALVLVYQDAAAKPMLALYRRGKTGYALAGTRTLPGPVNALAFAGAELVIGFERPVADGALVWAVHSAMPDPLVPVRRFELPAPAETKHEHLSELDASGRWILALRSDAAWVLDASGSGPTRRLELPPAGEGKPPRPTGVLMGSAAVILLAGRIGVFALE
jgi:hypothetical protein